MNCKLCKQNKVLQESHIFPKFAFRWLKQYGGSYIRKPNNPNMRHQDGLKMRLLCCDCEQLFSKFENGFSRDIFYPHVNHNKTTFQYDINLYNFSISVLWRVLLTGYDTYVKNNSDFITEINFAEKEWREYLFQNKPIERFNKVYIFFTTHGLNYEVQPIERFLQYYASGIDGDIVHNANTCFIYVKLAKVIIIGEIQNPENIQFSNEILSICGGNFSTLNLKLDSLVKEYLIFRVADINRNFEKVSETQKEIAIQHTNQFLKEFAGDEISKIIKAQLVLKIDKNFLDF